MTTSHLLIENTIRFVQDTLKNAEGGHDWWHIHRVYLNAKKIAGKEAGVDMEIVLLAALLHDIADSKFHNGNEEIGPDMARNVVQDADRLDAIGDIGIARTFNY